MCYNEEFDPNEEEVSEERQDLFEDLKTEEKEQLLDNPNIPREDIDFLVDHITTIDPDSDTILEIVKNRKSYSVKRRKIDDLIDEECTLADLTLDNFVLLLSMDKQSIKSLKKSYEKTEEYINYKK